MTSHVHVRERGTEVAVPTATGTPRSPWRPYRAALDEEGGRLYDRIAAALRAHEETVVLDAATGTPYGSDRGKLEELVGELGREVPEVDPVSLAIVRRAGRGGSTGSAVALEVGYADDRELATAHLRTMEERAREAAAAVRARARGRDHLTALHLHDWLIERCTYEKGAPHAHDAVGALVLGRAVCDGIAKAYKFLCDRTGIACAVVTGRDRTSGRGHAWNAVHVAGRWSHVDLTGDLPGRAGGRPSRAHFGLSDEQVGPDRTADPGCPACPQGLGYFESLGLVARGTDDLERLMGRMLARGTSSFEVKLAGPLAYGTSPNVGAPAFRRAVERSCARYGATGCTTALVGMDVALLDVHRGRAS